MNKWDIMEKKTIELAAESWVKWILSDHEVEIKEQLSGEFQYVMRISDVITKVKGKEGEFIVFTEFQLRYDKKMPLRMHAYSALAREKYELPVYAIVVYLIPTGEEKEIESCYHCEFLGQVSHQDIHVIKIWEIDCEKIINKETIALIPFVPLTKTAP